MRYFISHPPDPRPALIVDVVQHAQQSLAKFKRDLWGYQTTYGLLIDLDECIFVGDSYTSLSVDSLEIKDRIKTQTLFNQRLTSLAELKHHVGRWLERMRNDWQGSLPLGTEVLIEGVVPALLDADIWSSEAS